MINITSKELAATAAYLQVTVEEFTDRYVEKGNTIMIMNTIPCHFLSDCKCSIYEKRFTECRAFPNLDQPNFKSRLFATLVHYGMCPIIFNVVEKLKRETEFFTEEQH
jgi:Fe-S-cluster containining protein